MLLFSTTDGATAAAFEATISPAVLRVWAQYVTDPLISEDALDVLESLAECPECLHPLFLRVVPSLAGVLAAPDQQPPGLVEGALDLLTLLLQVRTRCLSAYFNVTRALQGRYFKLKEEHNGRYEAESETTKTSLKGG